MSVSFVSADVIRVWQKPNVKDPDISDHYCEVTHCKVPVWYDEKDLEVLENAVMERIYNSDGNITQVSVCVIKESE